MALTPVAGQKLKIIVADDHRLFRTGIITTLKKLPIVSFMSEAENGAQVLELLEVQHYDAVLMDISMPVMNGVVATKEVMRRFPKTKIIVLSMYEDLQHIQEMFDNGASGYLFKNTNKEEIREALETVVINGNYFWTKQAGDELFNKIVLKKRAEKKGFKELLSEREKEVVTLICHECSTKEIAIKLNLSEKTVAWYREILMQKTQTKNSVGLAVFAITHGIVNTDDNWK